MLSELIQIGLKSGFLRKSSSNFSYGPLASNLLFNFRREWIESFIRHSLGRYNFLWVDSIDQIKPSTNLTIAWQDNQPKNSSNLPLILAKDKQVDDEYFHVRYLKPLKEINLNSLSNERTRFWKKYISQREKLQCISTKSNQFSIQYQFSKDFEPYQLETIESNFNDSSIDLNLNVNQTLTSLLIDSQMKFIHPLLAIYQIAIESSEKSTELCLYLSKSLTYQYHLRVLRLIDEQSCEHIPFHLILKDESIKNGVCFVRNRDTNLQEEIHVTQLAKNLSSYFKSLDDAI